MGCLAAQYNAGIGDNHVTKQMLALTLRTQHWEKAKEFLEMDIHVTTCIVHVHVLISCTESSLYRSGLLRWTTNLILLHGSEFKNPSSTAQHG